MIRNRLNGVNRYYFGKQKYFSYFGFTAQAPGSIFAKYVASENTIYRATLLLGYSYEKVKMENFANPDIPDVLNTNALHIGLSAGIEKHLDVFGRLSGYIGAQAGISNEPYSFYHNDTRRTYNGNFSFTDAENSDFNYYEKGGSIMSVFAGGILGVEFFIAPRVSLTGEFGYNLSFFVQSDRIGKPANDDEYTVEYGGSGFDLMPFSSGNLVLLFYF